MVARAPDPYEKRQTDFPAVISPRLPARSMSEARPKKTDAVYVLPTNREAWLASDRRCWKEAADSFFRAPSSARSAYVSSIGLTKYSSSSHSFFHARLFLDAVVLLLFFTRIFRRVPTSRVAQVQAGVRLLHQLVVGCVKDKIIRRLAVKQLVVALLFHFLDKPIVHIFQGLIVTRLRERPVHDGILDRVIGLEKVPHVRGVRRPVLGIEGQWRIAPDQHRHGPAPARGTGRTAGVRGNVGGHDNGVPAVPSGRFAPQKGVEQRRRAAVAGVDDRGTFHVRVAGEEVHEDRFGGFRLVHEGFGPDFQTTDGSRINVVSTSLEEGIEW